uniref:CCDC174 alpha/beta GRSR domain-containing protein n=1 Tax=Romanomermis culicivorax TaxID=13658 RepID=A0A915I2Q5_ROMCU
YGLFQLVDLKAELYKKRQDFAQKKAQNAQSINSEGFLNSVKKTIFDSSGSKKQQEVVCELPLNNEEEKKLDQSRKKLIEKAAIYDKLSSGDSFKGLLDDEGKSLCLVDFDRKRQQCANSDDESVAKTCEQNICQIEPSCSRETLQKHVSDDDDVCSEDEFVEFIDSFGRTRRCMRKDLQKFKDNDAKTSSVQTASVKRGNSHEDESRLDKPATESSKQEPNFVHYQHVSKDEIWDRGAGYYQFSSDEVERQQQMNRLNELRQQTREKRHSVEQLKEKRRKLMAQRLEKVKERKKLNIDLSIESKEQNNDIDLNDIELPGEAAIEAKRVRIEKEVSRAEHVRPWDVGKSKKTQGKFAEIIDPTVGVDFYAKIIQVRPDLRIKLQLWDTAGQEKFRSITRCYYRNSVGVFLVYDITRRESFEHITEWMHEAKLNVGPEPCLFQLIGHKADLDAERQVMYEEGEYFAKHNQTKFMETSAKSGKNVEEAFLMMLREIVAKIESGEIVVREGWDGVKAGMNKSISLTSCSRSLADEGRSKYCAGCF